ncbi:MAG: hypothetical protein ACI4P0_05285, partial [Mailhella sp.]
MAKIPQKFMGMLGKFAESLDYNDLPKGWADNPEIVSAAGELYRDMGTESPFFKAWFGNWPAAKAYNDAVSASPVVTLTGREFQKDGVPLTQKVPAWYDDTFQGMVRSPQLGEVRLDLEGVKDSLGHGIGREKSAAFAAVPDIIRKGTVFDRQSNWKGRGYDTSVISAPVRIGDTDYAGELVVKTGKDRQGLYLHEVENRKRLEDAFKTANGSAPQASRLILGQKLDDVKRSSRVVDGEGMPLLVYHETDDAFDTLSKAKSHDGGFSFTEKPDPQGSSGQEFYLKGTYGQPEERAARRAGLPVQELDYIHEPDKGRWMVKKPHQVKAAGNRGTFNPEDPDIYKALPFAVGGGAAAAMMPDEAEAAVYSKDGRRLLNLLDKASQGALPVNEPVFEFQERLPRDIFKAAKEDNGAFHSRKFAADRNDIQHYWNARHGHMSNEEIENLVESLVTGKDRFYVRANAPYAESVGALGSSTGGRGALRPSEEFTYLHQVNPLRNERLLKMKSRSWETPDGSAFHPHTSHSPEGGATQRAFSADGVSDG